MNWYLEVLKKYAVFHGRARRSEYWWYTLVSMIVTMGLFFADVMTGGLNLDTGIAAMSTIYWLGTFLPTIGVLIRRLHDTDRTGWWMLVVFIPIIGGIAMLVFMFSRGTTGSNTYGPDPKDPEPEDWVEPV